MTRISLLLLVLVMSVGCRSKTEITPPVTTSSASAEPAVKTETNAEPTPAKPAEADGIQLTVCSFDELNQAIAKHSGKVVICDFWSTSCAPCLRELPHLVELSTKHPADKLVCMTASLDFEGLPDQPVPSLRAPVLEVLTEKKAKLENYLLNEENEAVYEKLKLASIPAVYVYGADGKLAKRFDESAGTFSYEKDINPFVEELLKAAK